MVNWMEFYLTNTYVGKVHFGARGSSALRCTKYRVRNVHSFLQIYYLISFKFPFRSSRNIGIGLWRLGIRPSFGDCYLTSLLRFAYAYIIIQLAVFRICCSLHWQSLYFRCPSIEFKVSGQRSFVCRRCFLFRFRSSNNSSKTCFILLDRMQLLFMYYSLILSDFD